MPEHLRDVWPCYRAVLEHKYATWTDVWTTMSVYDVLDLNEAADLIYDAVNTPPPNLPQPPKGY